MFANDRGRMREFLCACWYKQRNGEPLEPLERLVADIVARHPEYHEALQNPETAVTRDYLAELGESNPFLHLGMHIALQEQLTIDRPAGILAVYQQLCRQLGDAHQTEHQMMECLAATLWAAQQSATPPDVQSYLERLRKLL